MSENVKNTDNSNASGEKNKKKGFFFFFFREKKVSDDKKEKSSNSTAASAKDQKQSSSLSANTDGSRKNSKKEDGSVLQNTAKPEGTSGVKNKNSNITGADKKSAADVRKKIPKENNSVSSDEKKNSSAAGKRPVAGGNSDRPTGGTVRKTGAATGHGSSNSGSKTSDSSKIKGSTKLNLNVKNAEAVNAATGKKKSSDPAFFKFFQFKNIPIVNLVYIGFSILLILLISISALSFVKFSTLKSAFQEVTEKATPVVLNADRVEADLISTHKSLVDILTATNATDIKRLTTIYENERKKLSDSNAKLIEIAKNEPKIASELNSLNSVLDSYFNLTSAIPQKYLDWAEDNNKSLVRISKYRSSVGFFNSAYASVQHVLEEEDDFVFQESKTAEMPKGVLMNKVDESLSSYDPALIKKNIDDMQFHLKQFVDLIKTMEKDWPNFKNELGSYYTPFISDISGEKGVLLNHYNLALRQAELKRISKEANSQLDELREIIARIGIISNNSMVHYVSNAYNLINSSYLQLLAILVFGIIVALCVAIVVGRVIRVPLHRIVETINAMCDYDMTKKVNYSASSEFGFLARKINQLIDVFRDMLGQIAKSSDTLKSNAHDNSESMTRTSLKIKEQLDQTALIDSAMSALKSASDNVAESAEVSLNQIISSNDTAENGRRLMSDNITTNHLLSSKLQRTNDVICNVREMSDNIGQIVGVIKDIANQTNLLALNAAIESAHAGELGKGFAVVADQVRSLAHKTSEATRDVENLIQSLHAVVDEAVNNVKECGDEMNRSEMQTSEVNSSIEELKAVLTTISDMAHQIASAAEEQRCTTDEINNNIDKISNLSDENALEIQKAKELSLMLDRLATEQKQLVGKFKF